MRVHGEPLQSSLSPNMRNPSPSLAPGGGAEWGLCTPGWLLSPGHPLCSVCLWGNAEDYSLRSEKAGAFLPHLHVHGPMVSTEDDPDWEGEPRLGVG